MKLGSLSFAAICAALAMLSSCTATAPERARSSERGEADCAALASLRLDHVEIEAARFQPANVPVEGALRPGPTGTPRDGVEVQGLPAFCRVTGVIRPEPTSHIRFEVWLPSADWTGRFIGANNGGFAGFIRYDDLAAAVRAGAAGGATDTGHSGLGMESDWARGRPDLVRDFGWRGIHEMTVAAKDVIETFYGRRPDHSYFVGCSNGGRQGLMEAARFPDDYDGIVAGAPAAAFTDVVMSMMVPLQAQLAPGARIRGDQLDLLQSEVLRQCDGLDGQEDGVVERALTCRFDASRLACGVSNAAQCFTPPQIAALERIHSGRTDASGRVVASGYPPAGVEAPGWFSVINAAPFSNGVLRDIPATPVTTPEAFDFDADVARLRSAVSADLDAQPDLRRFVDRGGKLIIWHGLADPLIPPQIGINFYEEAMRRSGAGASDSLRLFLMPGVLHCAGGPGADGFGQIGGAQPGDMPEYSVAAAIQAWVEEGRVPESIIGRHGIITAPASAATTPMERLFCAYPAEAVLRPGADRDKASSYVCRARQSR